MILASVIAGIAAVLAAGIGLLNQHKIQQVHVLVNSRLDTALHEIDLLKKSLKFEKTQPASTSEDES